MQAEKTKYEVVIALYERVITIYKQKKLGLADLLIYFEKDVAEQLRQNVSYNSSLEFGWFKIVRLTNFDKFIKSAEYFLELEA